MMNEDFDNYESVSSAEERITISKASYRTSLSEQSRRLSNCINAMKNSDTRVSFRLDRSVVAEVRELAQMENVSLSEMCNLLLVEYLNEG